MTLTKEDIKLKKELTEQISKLSAYEKYFEMSKRNYIIIRPQTLGELFSARYGTDWRNQVSRQVTTCSTCKLREILKIAMEYDSMLKTLKQLEEKAEKEKPSKKNNDDNE